MSRPLRALLHALAGIALLASVPLAAPTELDIPSVEQGAEATTLVQLTVTAGLTGAPNGFTIEWIPRTLYDDLAGWPEDPFDPRIHSASFLGSPSLNTDEGTSSFLLGAGQSATVELGDIFDETGVLATSAGELAVGTEYAVRVRANGEGGISDGGGSLVTGSPNSETYFCRTKENEGREDCVHSQGYWKTHPNDWPVSSLRLGSIIYSKAQLLAIWDKPAEGNGLISLAHQLMAAKLNIIAGAIAPGGVTTAIASADALIGLKVIPPFGTGYIAPGTSSALTETLEDFNTEEQEIQCHHVTTVRQGTWSQLKTIYR